MVAAAEDVMEAEVAVEDAGVEVVEEEDGETTRKESLFCAFV